MRHRRELKKWKSVREKELLEEERNELEREEAKIKQKVQADIDLVARKLNEESREKRQQQALEMNEKYRVSEILLSLFRYFFRCIPTSLTYSPPTLLPLPVCSTFSTKGAGIVTIRPRYSRVPRLHAH
jgi:hypothetical protein